MKQRNSSIELLRIIAALFVIILHYNNPEGFNNVVMGGNFLILNGLESISIGAVNVFLIISGYFLCKNYTRSLGKIVNLPLQVVFFQEIGLLVLVLTGGIDGNGSIVKHLIYNLLPRNYFVTLYVVLYIISPYINYLISK